jgi:hypothetical protein
MKIINLPILFLVFVLPANLFAQKADPYQPDFSPPAVITGLMLVWNDEFNTDGKPDPVSWRYEKGFVRNHELQWNMLNTHQQASRPADLNSGCSGALR